MSVANLLADVRVHLAKLEDGMVRRTEGDDIADLHLAVTDLTEAVARLHDRTKASELL